MSDDFEIVFYNIEKQGLITQLHNKTFMCSEFNVNDTQSTFIKLQPKYQQLISIVEMIIKAYCVASNDENDVGKYKVIKSSYLVYYGKKGIVVRQICNYVIPKKNCIIPDTFYLDVADVFYELDEKNNILFKLCGSKNMVIKYDWNVSFK